MRLLTALALLPALATPVLADNLTDLAPGFPGQTYLDLVRTIAPDITETAGHYDGSIDQTVRSIAYPDDPAADAISLSMFSISTARFQSEGHPMLALLLNSTTMNEDEGAILAIFDPRHPGAVDLADVSYDQHTGFASPALLPLGDSDDGLVISGSHFNSSQGYTSTAIIALVDGKLTQMASAFTFNDRACGFDRQQNLALAPVYAEADGRWQPFSVTVTEVTIGNDCESSQSFSEGTRAVADTFRWSASNGGYYPDGDALDRLSSETQDRF